MTRQLRSIALLLLASVTLGQGLTGCSSTSATGTAQLANANEPLTALLVISMTRGTSLETDKYEMKSLVAKPTRRMDAFFKEAARRPGFLLVSLLDDTGAIVHQVSIAHPLRQRVEYSGEDDMMESTLIIKDADELVLMIPYISAMESVRLEFIETATSTKFLKTLSLPALSRP